MIETSLLSAWDGFVSSVALIALIVLAICVMVRAVKPGNILRHLGRIVGVIILLIMLPAIIVSLWNSTTFGQRLGIATMFIVVIFLIRATRRRSERARR